MAIEGSTLASAELRTFTNGVITETVTVGLSDVDMLAVDLVGGVAYEIDVDNGNDSYLRIFDRFGNEVMANDDGADFGEAAGLNPYVQFMANYTGRYYIAFSPYYLTGYDPAITSGRFSPENPLVTAVSDVTITHRGTQFFADSNSINAITEGSTNDESDVIADADRQIRIEYTVQTSIATGSDVEMGRFDLVKGDMLVVDINGQVGVDTLDAVLRAFNSAGVQIGFDNGSGNGEDSEFVIVAPTTGAYYVAVTGEGNSSYNALDGTGTLVGVTGAFTAVVHLNPTQVGTSLANLFTGSAGDNYIVGLAGNDTISGNDGDDTLSGGDDNDGLIGGNGQDQLYGDFGNDGLFGGNGQDVLVGGDGADSLDGGAGTDILEGGLGNDTLLGGVSTFVDTLYGGAGDDSLNGQAGNDQIHGDAGNDTLTGDTGNDTMFGGLDADVLTGGGGDDSLDGGSGNDSLNGGSGNDTLLGDAGNDTLLGDIGSDVLFGGAANDSLSGGNASDTLTGGIGTDTLNGGSGADVFVFQSIADGADLIEDFQLGIDRIDLSAIFLAAGSVVTPANLSQYLQITPAGAGADSFLGIDANGLTGGVSFTIVAQVNGVTPVNLFDAANFIL